MLLKRGNWRALQIKQKLARKPIQLKLWPSGFYTRHISTTATIMISSPKNTPKRRRRDRWTR